MIGSVFQVINTVLKAKQSAASLSLFVKCPPKIPGSRVMAFARIN